MAASATAIVSDCTTPRSTWRRSLPGIYLRIGLCVFPPASASTTTAIAFCCAGVFPGSSPDLAPHLPASLEGAHENRQSHGQSDEKQSLHHPSEVVWGPHFQTVCFRHGSRSDARNGRADRTQI